jgi:parvulin-like peptidyl-prolyl isomerase
VGDEQIDRFVEMIKEKNQLTDAQLTMALNRGGIDMKRYRNSIRTEIEKERLISKQVKAKVSVTPEDVQRYYQANKNKFRTKDRVRLRHILIQIPDQPTPEEEKAAVSKALEIRKLAIAGESFAQLAQKYSQGAGASEGGEIGWVDRSSLISELANAAFKMSAGDISQPIRTSLGIHILKVEDRNRGTVKPLSEVEEKIKSELNARVSEEQFLKWLKTDLRKNHQVDVKVPGVVFRAEETKEGTVNALMASEFSKEPKKRSLLSKLNPFSYIFKSTPDEEEEGEYPSDERTVSIFGMPIFRTESAGDFDEEFVVLSEPAAPAEGTAQTQGPTEPEASQEPNDSEKSSGFFSKVLDGLNPF